ncbi:hypothetical protein H8959_002701 [Pygathrix nigripes]
MAGGVVRGKARSQMTCVSQQEIRCQGENIRSEQIDAGIDENVLGAQLDVEAAHSEILKYFQSVTSNRWLMVKIFLILIVFFIIFVVFLA